MLHGGQRRLGAARRRKRGGGGGGFRGGGGGYARRVQRRRYVAVGSAAAVFAAAAVSRRQADSTAASTASTVLMAFAGYNGYVGYGSRRLFGFGGFGYGYGLLRIRLGLRLSLLQLSLRRRLLARLLGYLSVRLWLRRQSMPRRPSTVVYAPQQTAPPVYYVERANPVSHEYDQYGQEVKGGGLRNRREILADLSVRIPGPRDPRRRRLLGRWPARCTM